MDDENKILAEWRKRRKNEGFEMDVGDFNHSSRKIFTPNKKVAYFLLVFFGYLGAHRYYVHLAPRLGVLQLILGVIVLSTFLSSQFIVGGVFLGILVVWLAIDFYILPDAIDFYHTRWLERQYKDD